MHQKEILTKYAKDNGFDIMSIFRDVFNEWFVADTSKKIRAVFKAKALNGKHSNSVAPYGYKPSDGDEFVLDIDEPAAEVVRDIFKMCVEGMGPQYIAKELSSRGLKIPQIYKAERDSVVPKHIPKHPDTVWHTSVVSGILANRECSSVDATYQQVMGKMIPAIIGEVDVDLFGFTLVHEHILFYLNEKFKQKSIKYATSELIKFRKSGDGVLVNLSLI